jgi:hypothetical protein
LQQQKIVASDRDANDSFGFRVSLSGNNAIIGAWKESEDENGANTLGNAGSSYIFERNSSGNWNQKQKLVASDRAPGDAFGYAVSISGSTAFVAAPLEDNDVLGGNFLSTSGSVYAYCLSSSSTISVSACVSYTSPGGNVYTSSNTYIDTIVNTAGCDSIITIQLTIKPLPNVTTSLNALTITANQTGATYQWFNCDSSQLILNATNQSFTASVNGNYAVIVSMNGCSDTSACVNINNVGIVESTLNNLFSIYPNPNSGTFVIESKTGGLYSLVNSLGQEVKSFYLNAENKNTVSLEDIKAGVYYIFELNNNKMFKQKVVIIK